MLIKTTTGYVSTKHIVSYGVYQQSNTEFLITARAVNNMDYYIETKRLESKKIAFVELERFVNMMEIIIYNHKESK